jgi:hypothetical protein
MRIHFEKFREVHEGTLATPNPASKAGSGCRKWLDACSNLTSFAEFDAAHIVTALQVNPELWFHAEEQSERVGHLGLNWPPAFDDLIDGLKDRIPACRRRRLFFMSVNGNR